METKEHLTDSLYLLPPVVTDEDSSINDDSIHGGRNNLQQPMEMVCSQQCIQTLSILDRNLNEGVRLEHRVV